MSMLAEPRRRKNYVLTPRGKPLYEDDSRFGSKMLQKMGWTKGKGLGAKESGQTDFVRVNFKSDAGGLGFEKRDDQWTQHEHGFNGLLQSLYSQKEDVKDEIVEEEKEEEIFQTTGFGFKSEKKLKAKVALSGESLEEKSKQSKARVHYKKFTRGKDLSQYSEKDLANIFGKKALEIDNDTESSNVCDIEETNTAGLLETKSTSIADYFKEKIEKRKGNQSLIDSDLIPVQNKVDSLLKSSASSISDYFKQKMEERKAKQGIQQSEQENKNSDSTPVSHNEESTRKKRKREKKAIINDTLEETLPETYCPVESGEKRKKVKISEVENLADEAISESGPTTNNDNDPKHNDIENNDNSTFSKKKTKKSKKNYQPILQENSSKLTTSISQQTLDVELSVKLIKGSEMYKIKKESKRLDDYNDAMENCNVYTISSYVAEKFRRAEFEKFVGSNMKDLNGYSFDENVKLNIVQSFKDEQRIIKFWEGSLNKYSRDSRPKKVYKAPTDTTTDKVAKPKLKKRSFNISKHKRKSAFKVGI